MWGPAMVQYLLPVPFHLLHLLPNPSHTCVSGCCSEPRPWGRGGGHHAPCSCSFHRAGFLHVARLVLLPQQGLLLHPGGLRVVAKMKSAGSLSAFWWGEEGKRHRPFLTSLWVKVRGRHCMLSRAVATLQRGGLGLVAGGERQIFYYVHDSAPLACNAPPA